MPIFDEKPYKREPFHPLAKFGLSRGEEAWTGDLVRLRPADKRPRARRTFGVELSGYWETAIFLGIADPRQPEIIGERARRPDREILSSDISTLVLSFFVNGSGLLMLSKETIRLLEIQLVKNNQAALVYCSDQRVVRLFPFETGKAELGGLALRDFDSTARVLNPYWLPVDLQEKDRQYYEARVGDLSILHSQYQARKTKEETRPKITILTRVGGSNGDKGPVFVAPTMKQAKETLEDFVETFGVYLTVYKIVYK